MGNLVQIAQFFDPEEAFCAKGFLLSNGIDTIVQNEHHLTAAPWLRVALGGYRLLTISDFEEDARYLLESVSQMDSSEMPVHVTPDINVYGLQKPRERNWIWLPIAFLSYVPFVPFYRSKWSLFIQCIALVMLYCVAIVFGIYYLVR